MLTNVRFVSKLGHLAGFARSLVAAEFVVTVKSYVITLSNPQGIQTSVLLSRAATSGAGGQTLRIPVWEGQLWQGSGYAASSPVNLQ